MLQSLDLSGRVAVVIGGTSGLGRAIALGLAEAGADVVPSGRREALVQTACHQIEQSGRRSLAAMVDVLNRAAVDRVRDRVLQEFGEVHILVNSAGIMQRKPTMEVSESEWNSILDANLTGALRASQS